MNTSMIQAIDMDTGMGTIEHNGQMLTVNMGDSTVLDGDNVIGDINDMVMGPDGPTSVDWTLRVITPPDAGDAGTDASGPAGFDADALAAVLDDPMAYLYQEMFGIDPDDLTMGGRTVLGIVQAYVPFLGIIGLDATTLNNLFSEDESVRGPALAKVSASITNLDTLIGSITPGLQNTSETVADMFGGILSGLLGRMDTSDPTAAFPDIIDGSTGLVRVLGEVGKFLSNFDLFAESMTGEARDGKMVKAFVANLDGLMENALTYIEGALMSKADADAAAAAAEAAAAEAEAAAE